MKYYNLFFSPTGGTQKVTYALMSGFDEKFISVDMITKTHWDDLEFEKNDFCLVSVPSYGGRVPWPAAEMLSKLDGKGAKAALVIVYGNRAIDDTMCELSDILENANFKCIAGIEAVAEHSLIPNFGKGRPDAEDAEDLQRFAKEIKANLLEGHSSHSIYFPGNRPYVKYNGVPLKPKATNKCTACGLCAKECPAHAIPKDNPKLTNKDKCISCMHCVYICPEKARKISSIMVSAAEAKMKKSCSGRKPNKLYI